MPIPLIPVIVGAVSAAAAAYGAKKAIDAHNKTQTAAKTEENAQDIVKRAKKALKLAKKVTKSHIEDLGTCKLEICAKTLKHFVDLFEQIKEVELQDSPGLNELSKFKMDKASFAQIKASSDMASAFVSGSASGIIAAGAVVQSAYGAVGTFGIASTNTAIAGLHGAAATNATLAALGGGAKIAGGLGITGGCAVLGAAAAGAAIAIMGTVMDSKATKKLNTAAMNLAKAKEYAEAVDVVVTKCKGIVKRADLFKKVLIYLEAFLFPQLRNLENVIQNEGTDYRQYSDDAKKQVAVCVATVQALKAVLDVPMLTKNGDLTDESETVLIDVCKQQNILV